MKIDPLLEKELEWRFKKQNRKIIFITRVKMFIQLEGSEWQQNSSGLLILCQKIQSHMFTIINVMNFQINFDYQLYTNFTSYCKFLGDQKCLIFLAPTHSKILKIMFVLESKSQLGEFKRIIDKIYATVSDNSNLDFLSRPHVIEVLKKAEIDQNILAVDQTFREQVQNSIKKYFADLQNKNQQNKKKAGFKSYALGRDQWKLQPEQVNFLKEKLFQDLSDNLNQYQKQARIRMKK